MNNNKNQIVEELHSQFVKCGMNAKKWIRECMILLPEIAMYKVWKKRGFKSIHEYAYKLAGMNKRCVDDALRIHRRIEGKPALQEVVREKGISSVRPVVTIATKETDEFWAEKAMTMSKNTLEVYVREFKNDKSQTCNLRPRTESQPEKLQVSMDLDEKTFKRLEKLKGDGDWGSLMNKLANLHEREEARQKVLEKEKPEPVVTESRYNPVEIRNYIKLRSQSLCEYPRCNKSGDIVHHTQRFGLEKVHDPERMYYLCKAHEGVAHHTLIDNEELEPAKWRIRMLPDTESPKYEIDQMVNAFRVPT